jgi:hypothetical protein
MCSSVTPGAKVLRLLTPHSARTTETIELTWAQAKSPPETSNHDKNCFCPDHRQSLSFPGGIQFWGEQYAWDILLEVPLWINIVEKLLPQQMQTTPSQPTFHSKPTLELTFLTAPFWDDVCLLTKAWSFRIPSSWPASISLQDLVNAYP